MQNSNFEDNLRFFKDLLPYGIFYELIRNKNSFFKIEIKESENYFEIKVKDDLHIKIDKEVKYLPPNSKIIVFTSFLSFCIYQKNITQEQELFIILLEDLYYLGSIFLSFNLKEIIQYKDKIFFIKSDYDIDFLINFLNKNLSLLSNPIINIKIDRYDEIISENHKILIYNFASKLNEFLIDYNTHLIMLPKQIINTIENIKYIKKTVDIIQNKDNITLVVSAGPSLNDQLEKIKKLKDFCLIIVVDTALRFLLKNGIEPDLIIALDPQVLNFLDFLGINNLINSILAIEISSTYKITEKFKDYENTIFFTGLLPSSEKKELFLPVNNLSDFICKTYSLYQIPVYGNVGLAAISFATKISNNIILAGFDSSFNSLVYHCKETLDINYHLNRQNYLNPALSKLNLEALAISYKNNKRNSILLEKNKNIFNKNFPDNNFIYIENISKINKDSIQVLINNNQYNFDLLKKNKKQNLINYLKTKKVENIYYNKDENRYEIDKFKNLFKKSIDDSFKFFEIAREKSKNKIENSLKRLFQNYL